MPIYEYRCKECQQVFEEWQKDFAEHQFSCPVCGGGSDRLISNTSFVLKGGGWYVTDYGRGDSGPNGKAGGQKAEGASSETPSTPSPGTSSSGTASPGTASPGTAASGSEASKTTTTE